MVFRYRQAPTNRQLRVSQLVRQEMSSIFARGDVFHPSLEMVMLTIVDVKISADLKIITIFISIVKADIEDKILEVLNYLAPEYRKKLSGKLNMKYTPSIRFAIDKHIDNKISVDKLLEKISTK
jgi:ribosome-binding factor A